MHGTQTTFGRNAPPGFRFLPVGTSELAERCKELSRQRDMAINVVNVRSIHTQAIGGSLPGLSPVHRGSSGDTTNLEL